MSRRALLLGTLLLCAGQFACENPFQPAAEAIHADAGEDVSIAAENGFTLNATVTGGVAPYVYRWTLEQKTPTTASFELDGEHMDAALEVETIDEEGSYVFRVRVTDSVGQTDTDFVTVYVGGDLDITATVASPLTVVGEGAVLGVSIDESTNGLESKTFLWEVLQGEAEIADPGVRNPVAIVRSADTLRFKITVNATIDGDERLGVREVDVVGINDTSPQVVIENSGGVEGDIVLELRTAAAPNTCANFLRYVDEGFFDGIIWHRVVDGFVIQGGAYERVDGEVVRRDGTRDPVESEALNGYSNIRGAVAMALAGTDADSGTNQFFINLDDNSSLDDGTPPFTVFARVVDGLDVVDDIATVGVTDEGALADIPVDDIVMSTVRRLEEEVDSGPDDFDYDPDNPDEPDPSTNGVEVVATADNSLRIVGQSTQLHATVTDPPDDIEYEWQVITGSATFSDDAIAEPTVTINSAETALLRVNVLNTDGDTLGSADAYVVGVSDSTPEVEITNEGLVDGTIVIELLTDEAPIACANFLRYVDDGFYDGIVWHRVIADSEIRTGLFYRGDVRLEARIDEVRDAIVGEASNGLLNVRGNVAMASTPNGPDTATSQFLINVEDNPDFDSDPPHTVFARVIQGMSVVDEISTVEVGTAVVNVDGQPAGFDNVPTGGDVTMVSVTRR